MVSFYRDAALFIWRRRRCSSGVISSLRKGLNQLVETSNGVSNNLKFLPLGTSFPSILTCSQFCTTPAENSNVDGEFHDVGSKTKDTAEIFKEWGCSDSDISKIFQRCPSMKRYCIHLLQSKLEVLSHLGINSSELVKMVHCRPRLLICKFHSSLKDRLQYLEDTFGSRETLVKAIVRNPSLLTNDFHEKLKVVISMYESLGLSRSDLTKVLLSRPTLIPRSNLDDEKLQCIQKTGVPVDSKMYKHVVSLFAVSRMKTIREKITNMEKFGLSEEEIFHLIGRSPVVLTLSVDKIQRNMTCILGTMKLPVRVVLSHPFLLYSNLESQLRPRFQIASMIDDMGLEPRINGPALMRALRMSDKRFVSAFIRCHKEGVAEELMKAYQNAKCVRLLAESSKRTSPRASLSEHHHNCEDEGTSGSSFYLSK